SLMLALGFVTTRKVDLPKSNWGMNDRFVLRLLNVASSERYLEEIDFISTRKAASLWTGDHRQASRADHIPVSRAMLDELAPQNEPLLRTKTMAHARRGDFSLVKSKKLVGGGEITIVNKTVPMALEKLGYAPPEVDEVVAFVDERNTVIGAPYVKPEHYPVFDCAIGERAIHYTGHVKMMGA